MNFFGHAAVASSRTNSAAEVLGAMLPDLAAMIGTRPPAVRHADLQRGVRLHHRTDEVFHELLFFRQLTASGFRELSSRGLSRGSARAAAHVGIEIQIDGELGFDARARTAYLSALAAASTLSAAIDWPPGAGSRFSELCASLRRRGVSPRHSDPPALARRVQYTLARRPRLALAPDDLQPLEAWATGTRPRVALRMPELTNALARL